MEMIDGLAAVFTGVYDGAIAIDEAFFPRDLCDDGKQVAKQWSVFRRSGGERCDVFARDNQQMHFGVGMDVGEDDALLIFIDAGGRNGSFDDLAK